MIRFYPPGELPFEGWRPVEDQLALVMPLAGGPQKGLPGTWLQLPLRYKPEEPPRRYQNASVARRLTASLRVCAGATRAPWKTCTR